MQGHPEMIGSGMIVSIRQASSSPVDNDWEKPSPSLVPGSQWDSRIFMQLAPRVCRSFGYTLRLAIACARRPSRRTVATITRWTPEVDAPMAPTTAPDRAAINRRNAQKSTGPRSAEGKSRSKFNALKHGMTAASPVLPGEDPEAFRARIDAWKVDLKPQNTVEDDLIERAARVSWQLDRVERTHTARLAENIRHAGVDARHEEAGEAAALGRRLFWDARGPLGLYPHSALRDRQPRVSYSGLVDDPDHPAALVHQLEGTATGCRW